MSPWIIQIRISYIWLKMANFVQNLIDVFVIFVLKFCKFIKTCPLHSNLVKIYILVDFAIHQNTCRFYWFLDPVSRTENSSKNRVILLDSLKVLDKIYLCETSTPKKQLMKTGANHLLDTSVQFSSVPQSWGIQSLWPHRLQHSRLHIG